MDPEDFSELIECVEDEPMGWSFWFKVLFGLWLFS